MFLYCRDMRVQFGTLLADIGLIEMPKDILVESQFIIFFLFFFLLEIVA